MASFAGAVKVCKWLINKGANVLAIDTMGRNAMHFASYAGHLSIVLYFISLNNIDLISRKDSCGWAPYFTAASEGHVDIVCAFTRECMRLDPTFMMDPGSVFILL